MKTIILLLALIFAISSAYAACTDTDGGPIDPAKPTKFVGIRGAVDYGTGPKEDYCVSRFAGTFMPAGSWVREYYCDGDRIASEDYECKEYNYASCVNGTCINYTGTQAALYDVGTPPQENYSNCGNKKLDGKEECDPPGKVCMIAGGGIGTCTSQCKCVKASQTVKTEANSTNQTQNTSTASQANQTAEANQSTGAKMIFEADAGKDTENKDEKEEKQAGTPTGAIPAEIEEIMDETDKEIEKMANSPMIKITSAITKAFMKIWSLVSGLFGR